jgi:hypothetical protein
MPNYQGNPLQLNLSGTPTPAYVQPGAPTEDSNYAIDGDQQMCPYCLALANRVGSGRFGWLCLQGHQYDIDDNGGALLLSNAPLMGIVGTSVVRTEPR